MKKFMRSLCCMFLAALVLVLATNCSTAKLDTPVAVLDNDELVLSWAAVPNARSYRLEISSAADGSKTENTVQRTSYDLSHLAEGDYELRLRSVGGASNDIFSDWSERLAFHRDHDSGLLYTLINGNTEYEVRNVGSASGEVVIDGEYRGKPVTSIGATAFRGSTKVTSVVIPDTVTSIGASAFYNCSGLVSVQVPESVTSIGKAAFQQCSNLAAIHLPAALTSVEPFTFAYCRALEEIEFGENIVSIGESAFTNCSSFTELTFPDSLETIGGSAFRQMGALAKVTFGSGIRSIGSTAFNNCAVLEELVFSELDGELTFGTYTFAQDPALNNVVLPEGVTAISQYCFALDTALDEISIPASVAQVEPYAFYGAKLYTEQMEKGDGLVYADHWIVDATQEYKTTVEVIDEGTFRTGTVGIADTAFRYTHTFEEETVDEEGNTVLDEDGNPEMHTVTEYISCEKLKRIRFPSSLRYVGMAAFYHAPVLARLIATEDENLVSIGAYAFALCEGLNNVQFTEGLKEIGTRAFFRCTLLDYNPNNPELIIPDSVTRVGENAFYGTALWNSEDTTADGIVYAGNWVVGYHIDPVAEGEQVQSIVELREGTAGICDYAFYADTTLQNITGLNGVTRIGKGAFAYCSDLSNVTLNRNLRVIEDYTFYMCRSIYSVTFPALLQSIGYGAFYRCEQLHGIDLLETQVSSIGDHAFRGCSSLREAELGERLESVGEYAFYDCWLMNELVLPDTVTSIGKRAFSNCSSLTSITFGAGLREISDYAFAGCEWLRTLTVPATVTAIGNYAFYNCKRLKSLNIEEGVETIGHYAFYGNVKLPHVTIPASVRSIGLYAFKGCTELTSVLLKGSPEIIDENAFYACPRLTIYSTEEGEGANWSALWNPSQRPTVWGVTLSDDGSYVQAVTVGEITHPHARLGYSGPGREGYVFAGWAAESGSEVVYSAAELEGLAGGTTVYSVWEEAPEEDADVWFEEFLEWLEERLQQESGETAA